MAEGRKIGIQMQKTNKTLGLRSSTRINSSIAIQNENNQKKNPFDPSGVLNMVRSWSAERFNFRGLQVATAGAPLPDVSEPRDGRFVTNGLSKAPNSKLLRIMAN